MRKSDNNRIARACGATIVNRTDELKEDDVGTGAGLFEIKKVMVKIEVFSMCYRIFVILYTFFTDRRRIFLLYHRM